MKADVGPDREHADLSQEETDAFTALIEGNTKTDERRGISYALRNVRAKQGVHVQDGFQRNARKMWRSLPPAGGTFFRNREP